VGSSSSAAYSMTLSVPPTVAGSRRSSFNASFDPLREAGSDLVEDVVVAASARMELLPPHCHEMLSDDSDVPGGADGCDVAEHS
jgi:hypothetical protein